MNKVKKLGRLVLLAAIGSASWEFLLRGTLVNVADKVVLFISRFSTGIKNFPFENPQDIDAVFLAFPLLIFVTGFGYYVGYSSMTLYIDAKKFLLKRKYTISKNSGETYKRNIEAKVQLEVKSGMMKMLHLNDSKMVSIARYFPIAFFIIMFFLSISFLVGFSLIVVKYSVKRSTEANLEIVRPYVDQHDYLILNSRYYQLDGIASYIKLQNQLEDVAKEHNLSLQSFND